MKTGNRLVQYALYYKKTLIAALLMLTVAVGAELTGPIIAKKMIDDHIIGIEKPWYETSAGGKDTVTYNGTRYKREDRFTEGESKGSEVRILQTELDYYFIPEGVKQDGERKAENGQFVISNRDGETSYPAVKLSKDELMKFYEPEVSGIIFLMTLYFGLLVLASFFNYGQRFFLQVTSNRIIQRMRMDIFEHIQRLPIKYFDNLPAGKVVARVTNDTEAIRELYVAVLATFFTSAIYITGIFIALFLLEVKLALICLAIIPILVLWTIAYRKFSSNYNEKIRTLVSDINAMVNESIQGMTIIQAFRRQKEMTAEFEQLNEAHYTYQNKLLSINSLLSHNMVGFIRNVAFVALIWYFGGASLAPGSMVSLGVLYAFVDYLNRLFQPISGIVNQFAQLEQARVASNRVFSLLDEKGIEVEAAENPRYKGNVSFDHVYFGYTEGHDVLKDIHFEAKQGETVALVGHTGSGKSSIMNLLFRFYDVDRGSISIDGVNIKEMSRQEIRKHMGIVLQDPFLFTGTIASNVSLENEQIPREQIEKALKDVGAEHLLKSLPKGFDEPVIEKGSTLSSGQRQLISFARALAYDPAILILDEATASIDTETELAIQEALEVLKKGRTTFIIAHRLSTIKNADQILVLDRGEIAEKGSHDELMKAEGNYYQMYKLQQGKQSAGSSLAG
ncbi:ATP-binding cassette domain-containing protein [Bacillus mangrovi]|uniref:ATP-binding cassette domain-containing protein n=1 Tax=Metabacillus mangrovi TaxID=1491830 RepID=A0A7X2S7I2_9BACI|nr:ABC transporter ATP-binding protein [Metabacillus mangrovi]MTH54626.1 ATP-binding cassette domain-containing protein [Metabacillus mangrovi]